MTMANRYGLPDTMYKNIRTWDLFAMYRQSVWNKLSNQEREELFQETSNRLSIYNDGNMNTHVSFNDHMRPFELGSQIGSKVNINQEAFGQPLDSNNVNSGQMVSDDNWRALETVLHESRHVWQDAMADGNIPADNETRMRISSNGLDTSSLNGRPASQYLSGIKHGDLYYLNPTELDAHAFSQDMAAQIMDRVRQEYGEDESMRLYAHRLEEHGYETEMSHLQSTYGKDAALDVSNSLINNYYGTHIPISNPKLSDMVEEEMIATHDYYSGVTQQTCSEIGTSNGDSIESFDNADVSCEAISGDNDEARRDGFDYGATHNQDSSMKSDFEMLQEVENMPDCDYGYSSTETDYEPSYDYATGEEYSYSSSDSTSSDYTGTRNHDYSDEISTSDNSGGSDNSDDSNDQDAGIKM